MKKLRSWSKHPNWKELGILYEAWMKQSEERIVSAPCSNGTNSQDRTGDVVGVIHYVPHENFELPRTYIPTWLKSSLKDNAASPRNNPSTDGFKEKSKRNETT